MDSLKVIIKAKIKAIYQAYINKKKKAHYWTDISFFKPILIQYSIYCT